MHKQMFKLSAKSKYDSSPILEIYEVQVYGDYSTFEYSILYTLPFNACFNKNIFIK